MEVGPATINSVASEPSFHNCATGPTGTVQGEGHEASWVEPTNSSPKALRTKILRFFGPKTILDRDFGLF